MSYFKIITEKRGKRRQEEEESHESYTWQGRFGNLRVFLHMSWINKFVLSCPLWLYLICPLGYFRNMRYTRGYSISVPSIYLPITVYQYNVSLSHTPFTSSHYHFPFHLFSIQNNEISKEHETDAKVVVVAIVMMVVVVVIVIVSSRKCLFLAVTN